MRSAWMPQEAEGGSGTLGRVHTVFDSQRVWHTLGEQGFFRLQADTFFTALRC